ncbi:MAG: D-aminoacylase [Spirochaetales bacterium]|nr:D-aminoacylase [Spirochaetales bacterium]
MYSWILQNCQIIDGTGAPGFHSDIGISGDKIARIGNLKNAESEKTIDATKLVCAPGFIDMHSHSDLEALANPREENKLSQGVTTEIAGNCGYSLFPVTSNGKPAIKEMMKSFNKDIDIPWSNSKDYFDLLKKIKIGFNYYPLVGHGMLRLNTSGFYPEPSRGKNLKKMEKLLREEMENGCRGISTGLEYSPGCFSDTEELTYLAKVTAEYGGIYATHLRDQAQNLLASIEEALEIGRKAEIPVVISHLKSYGVRNWGEAAKALEMIEKGKAEGLKVIADFYPYTASSTTMLHELPRWVIKGKPEEILERLSQQETRKKISDEIRNNGELQWSKIMITSLKSEKNKDFIGQTITQISEKLGKDPDTTAYDLLIEEEGSIEIVADLMAEDDVNVIAQSPMTVVGSDAYALDINKEFHGHPRNFATFPFFIQKYVRENKLLTIEEAIRKTSGATADFLGLTDRGKLIENNKADIVLFNPEQISGDASYLNPGQLSKGIRAVFVNGMLEYESEGDEIHFYRENAAGEILLNK